jgi:hypothetical protein
MTPDPFRERDLAAQEIVATVRTDGVRAVVELSVDDLDRLINSLGGQLCDGCGAIEAVLCGDCVEEPEREPELCDVCWKADAKLCKACAVDLAAEMAEAT